MKYVVKTSKTVEQAVIDFTENVIAGGYGILHVHDLRETMRKKGVDFENECRILEVCNPKKASAVLSVDMEMNFVLPCRVSVYTDRGITKIGMIKPTSLLSSISDSGELREIAEAVERDLVKAIEKSI